MIKPSGAKRINIGINVHPKYFEKFVPLVMTSLA
jgi:hypothetical protein